MDFRNRLKGNLAQSLFETLLEDVKYRIVPLGIEEVIREVITLDREQYSKLGLSNTLRKLPDFFVAKPEFDKTMLVEIKYRRNWSDAVRDSLGEGLLEQVRQWEPLYLVMFLGEKARDSETPASYLGVCRLIVRENVLHVSWESTDFETGKTVAHYRPWREVTWGSFSRFQDVFDGVGERVEDATLIKVVEVVKSLNSIADPELGPRGRKNKKTGVIFLVLDERDQSILAVNGDGHQSWLDSSLFDDEEHFPVGDFTEVQIQRSEAFSKAESHEAEVLSLKYKANLATFNLLITDPVNTFKGLSNWCKDIPEFNGELVFLYNLGQSYKYGRQISDPDKSRGCELLRRAIELGYDGTAPKPWEARKHKEGR